MSDFLGSIGSLFSGGGSGGSGSPFSSSGGSGSGSPFSGSAPSGGSPVGAGITGGLAGLGEIGNIVSSLARGAQVSSLTNQENKIASLSPAAFTKLVQSAEAPINQGLTQSVDNGVQADLAQRGLAQAPGIFASEESQALAPFYQQQYQVALQQVLQQLGLPMQYAQLILKALPGQQNMTPALQLFLKQLAAKGGGTGGSSPTGISFDPGASGGGDASTPPFFDPASAPGAGSLDLGALGVDA